MNQNMEASQKIWRWRAWLAGAVFLAAVAVFLVVRSRTDRELDPAVAGANGKPGPAPRGQSHDHDAQRSAARPGARSRVDQLLEKWRALPESNADRELLIDECVRALSCSNEMLELFDKMNRISHTAAISDISQRIEKSLKSGDCRAMREDLALIKVSDKRAARYKRSWCFSAGEGCPPEEFAAFCAKLDPISARNATYGRGLALARTDPLGGLAMVLSVFPESGIPAREGDVQQLDLTYEILEHMMRRLKNAGDCMKALDMLPKGDLANGDGARSGYGALAEQFAKLDPAGAAEMVLKSPALFSDWSTVYVYYALPKEDRRGWLDRFPRGENFDEIVAALRLPGIQTNESGAPPHPTNEEIESALVELNEVRELTEQMGNETVRQSRLRLIESKIATFEKLRR
ncbi:MAG: hypothetical protein J0M04_09925 [Verrucomicrobia bacterium]|nr:hypothetical protein [Verrucomicrobiota bacterium]